MIAYKTIHQDQNNYMHPSTIAMLSGSPYLSTPPSYAQENLQKSPPSLLDTMNSSSTVANKQHFTQAHLDILTPLPLSECCCMQNHLQCLALLCNPQNNFSIIGLDSIMKISQQTSGHVKTYLCCSCSKESVNFVLTTILFQRLVKLFCCVAINGGSYLRDMKLGMGTFELSPDDDLQHKKLLITSTAKNINIIMVKMGNVVGEYERNESLRGRPFSDLVTESGKANLKWVHDSLQNLRDKLDSVIKVLEGQNWGQELE